MSDITKTQDEPFNFIGRAFNWGLGVIKGRKKKGATTPEPDSEYFLPYLEGDEFGVFLQGLFNSAESKAKGGALRLFGQLFGPSFREAYEKLAKDDPNGVVTFEQMLPVVVDTTRTVKVDIAELSAALLAELEEINSYFPSSPTPSPEESAAVHAKITAAGLTEDELVRRKAAWGVKMANMRKLQLEQEVASDLRKKQVAATKAANKAKAAAAEAAKKAAGEVVVTA